MKTIIARCGLTCTECGAYLATQANDDEKRREVAENWAKMYHHQFAPADINCNGCLSEEEPLFSHCRVCEIRLCARERQAINCAHCADYVCDKLNTFLAMATQAKAGLERIRREV
jgi:hypothetical protein